MGGLSGVAVNVNGFGGPRGQVPLEDVLGRGHSNFDTVLIVAFDFSVAFASCPKIDVFVAKLFLQEFLQRKTQSLNDEAFLIISYIIVISGF